MEWKEWLEKKCQRRLRFKSMSEQEILDKYKKRLAEEVGIASEQTT